MIRISQIKLSPQHSTEDMETAVCRALRTDKDNIKSISVFKRSIDARKKPDVYFVYTLDVDVIRPIGAKLLERDRNLSIPKVASYKIPESGKERLNYRPVIVGTGPAGLFCGLLLAMGGYKPLLLERGDTVEQRVEKVEEYWNTGKLSTRTNVQFGEGGAGTFSDGKLNTAVKDPVGRGRYILNAFVKAGAPEEILYVNKPHIGTDILQNVVKTLRKQIEDLGGEFRFRTQVTDLVMEGGQLKGLVLENTETIPCDLAILAIGHSARDTFEMLEKRAVPMEQKNFAVGFRIEHPQEMVDISQYGRKRDGFLPVADYKVTRQLPQGRGVYSFCMCPGGYVVNASSEEGRLAVNGMSYYDRGSSNANSAMVVTVTPKDFPSEHVLAGMEFQRQIEKNAWEAGQGSIPVQLLKDFCQGKPSVSLGKVTPCIKGSYRLADLTHILPPELTKGLQVGIMECEHLIKGFSREDAVLSGVESRTSSPVRILRSQEFESPLEGLYPCGEGAGYAGGITSAAMDGMKVAEAVIKKYAPF